MTTKSASKILRKLQGPAYFGGFLRAARTMRNLTQAEMGEFLGISKSNLCDIEKGRQNVSVELAADFARKCGLSEVMAVEYAIQDALRRAGLKMKVQIKKIA